MKFVLDTSAFIVGIHPEEGCYTVKEVVDEASEEVKFKIQLSLDSKTLKILEPAKDAVARVKKAAEETGDIVHLSKTDLKILSLALDFKEHSASEDVSILSDDYDIQNLARKLGISFTPIAEMGIRKSLIWKNICKGCRKEFPVYKNKCDICGSNIIKIAARQ